MIDFGLVDFVVSDLMMLFEKFDGFEVCFGMFEVWCFEIVGVVVMCVEMMLF